MRRYVVLITNGKDPWPIFRSDLQHFVVAQSESLEARTVEVNNSRVGRPSIPVSEKGKVVLPASGERITPAVRGHLGQSSCLPTIREVVVEGINSHSSLQAVRFSLAIGSSKEIGQGSGLQTNGLKIDPLEKGDPVSVPVVGVVRDWSRLRRLLGS